MDHLVHNPYLEVCPDFSSAYYEPMRGLMRNYGSTNEQIINLLTDAWVRQNEELRSRWGQQTTRSVSVAKGERQHENRNGNLVLQLSDEVDPKIVKVEGKDEPKSPGVICRPVPSSTSRSSSSSSDTKNQPTLNDTPGSLRTFHASPQSLYEPRESEKRAAGVEALAIFEAKNEMFPSLHSSASSSQESSQHPQHIQDTPMQSSQPDPYPFVNGGRPWSPVHSRQGPLSRTPSPKVQSTTPVTWPYYYTHPGLMDQHHVVSYPPPWYIDPTQIPLQPQDQYEASSNGRPLSPYIQPPTLPPGMPTPLHTVPTGPHPPRSPPPPPPPPHSHSAPNSTDITSPPPISPTTIGARLNPKSSTFVPGRRASKVVLRNPNGVELDLTTITKAPTTGRGTLGSLSLSPRSGFRKDSTSPVAVTAATTASTSTPAHAPARSNSRRTSAKVRLETEEQRRKRRLNEDAEKEKKAKAEAEEKEKQENEKKVKEEAEVRRTEEQEMKDKEDVEVRRKEMEKVPKAKDEKQESESKRRAVNALLAGPSTANHLEDFPAAAAHNPHELRLLAERDYVIRRIDFVDLSIRIMQNDRDALNRELDRLTEGIVKARGEGKNAM